jgi:hypothetical protein
MCHLSIVVCLLVGQILPAAAASVAWRGVIEGWSVSEPQIMCFGTIDHQAIHVPHQTVITITGRALYKDVIPYLSLGLPTDATWEMPPQERWIGFLLEPGDYVLSIVDADALWDPLDGPSSFSRVDYCFTGVYDVTISGDFIATGRWEGRQPGSGPDFTYTAQASIPEPSAAGLALAAVAFVFRGRTRSRA